MQEARSAATSPARSTPSTASKRVTPARASFRMRSASPARFCPASNPPRTAPAELEDPQGGARARPNSSSEAQKARSCAMPARKSCGRHGGSGREGRAELGPELQRGEMPHRAAPDPAEAKRLDTLPEPKMRESVQQSRAASPSSLKTTKRARCPAFARRSPSGPPMKSPPAGKRSRRKGRARRHPGARRPRRHPGGTPAETTPRARGGCARHPPRRRRGRLRRRAGDPPPEEEEAPILSSTPAWSWSSSAWRRGYQMCEEKTGGHRAPGGVASRAG